MLKIHKFDSTEEAYDATQCSADVSVGDILIIESEQVVGLADVWPIAVSLHNGQLHTVRPGFNWVTAHEENFNHVKLAVEIVEAYGWELAPAAMMLPF